MPEGWHRLEVRGRQRGTDPVVAQRVTIEN
jgi:hypothetical protein